MTKVRNGAMLVAVGLSILPGCAQHWGQQPNADIGRPTLAVTGCELALRWLKQAQDPKTGGWKAQKWGGMERMDCGVSGLALLAFLGYGCSDTDREFGDTVRRAIEFLIARQEKDDPHGRSFGESEYAQAICTIALTEASAFVGNSPYWGTRVKDAAQRGMDHVAASLPDDSVGSYDVPIMAWQIEALVLGVDYGLNVPESVRKKARRFVGLYLLDNYAAPGRLGVNPRWTTVEKMSTTAMSLQTRLRLGRKVNAEDCVGQAEWLTAGDRHHKVGRDARQLQTIFFMTNAFFQMGGQYWKNWILVFNDGLWARQVKDGPYRGSWPVEGTDYGHVGGRVYTTAMALLASEVYYEHLPTRRGEF